MSTIRQLLNSNARNGIYTVEPELHNLAIEAGFTGFADYVRKNPDCAEKTVSQVRADLLLIVVGYCDAKRGAHV